MNNILGPTSSTGSTGSTGSKGYSLPESIVQAAEKDLPLSPDDYYIISPSISTPENQPPTPRIIFDLYKLHDLTGKEVKAGNIYQFDEVQNNNDIIYITNITYDPPTNITKKATITFYKLSNINDDTFVKTNNGVIRVFNTITSTPLNRYGFIRLIMRFSNVELDNDKKIIKKTEVKDEKNKLTFINPSQLTNSPQAIQQGSDFLRVGVYRGDITEVTNPSLGGKRRRTKKSRKPKRKTMRKKKY